MIRRLNLKDKISLYDFINNCPDKFEDFYLTIGKERKFLKGNFKLIEKILKYQSIFAVEEKGEIKAFLLIYRDKGFRPYVKILSEKDEYIYDLLRFLHWNYNENLFMKIKKINPINRISQLKNKLGIPKYGWEFFKSRGVEILLLHRKEEKREIINDRYYSKN